MQQNNANSFSQHNVLNSSFQNDSPVMTAKILDNEPRSLPNGGVTVTPTSESKDAVGNLKVRNLLTETYEQSNAVTNGHGYPVEVRIIIVEHDVYRIKFRFWILPYEMKVVHTVVWKM